MNLDCKNTQSFGAKYVSPAKIKTKVGKYWKDLDVNFVKVDTRKNAADVKALQEVDKLWEGQNLSGEFNRVAELSKGKANIYALTTQKCNLENLEADKVLGLIDTAAVKQKVQLMYTELRQAQNMLMNKILELVIKNILQEDW